MSKKLFIVICGEAFAQGSSLAETIKSAVGETNQPKVVEIHSLPAASVYDVEVTSDMQVLPKWTGQYSTLAAQNIRRNMHHVLEFEACVREEGVLLAIPDAGIGVNLSELDPDGDKEPTPPVPPPKAPAKPRAKAPAKK